MELALPLLLIVFKQISAHIAHEANEQCRAVLLACGACKPLEHHNRPPSLHVCALPDSTSHCALCLRIVPRACSRIRAWTRCIGILVMVGTNQNKFKPSVKAIKELYYQKFRGKGGEP